MLRSLEIQNFKGIKQGKLGDLTHVNILVGRNNSGKSTILDALVLLRCAFVRQDYLEKDGLEQIIKRRVDRGNISYGELWFMRNTDVPITLSVEFGNGAKFIEEWSPGPTTKIRCEAQEWSNEQGYHAASARYYTLSADWQRLSKLIGEAEAARLALVHILDPGSIHYPFVERFWPELTKDRREDKIRQMLENIYRTEINYVTSMPFPDAQRLVAALPHVGVAVDWLGDGFRYAVNILALGVLLRGAALLVEELETHQHPESLKMLTQTLFELAKQQDLQLFLTTHSEELMNYALDAAEEKGIDLKLHHLYLNKEGILSVTSMSQPDAELLMDMGFDPRSHYKYIGVE